MHFLIVLVAIIALENNGQLAFIQRDIWVQAWYTRLSQLSILQRSTVLRLLAYVLVPVIVLYLVVLQLQSSAYGLLVFILELAVLLYSFGRGDLNAQIKLLESDIERDDLQAAYHDAAVFNIAHRSSGAESSEDLYQELIGALPYRIFERSFAVVFWFFLLGAPAALAYRLLALHGDMAFDQDKPDSEELEVADAQSANKLLWMMEWIPVRLLGLTLGLVGSFAHATAPLKELILCPRTTTADLLRRCVVGAMGDLAPAQSDSDSEGAALGGLELIAEIGALFRRSMMGWLVVIAILVLLS